MSKVITFYSYKGGVGRTMSLANIAVLLSEWKYKVLLIDWDLEAPGLENFFLKYIVDEQFETKKGLLDILLSYKAKSNKIKWQDCIIPISINNEYEDIHLISAGRGGEEYSKRLRSFNVDDFYNKHEGGSKLEELREELLMRYDFILIDSRTGVTDFGGICTIQLPDILVLLYTPTEQSLNGVKQIAKRAVEVQKNIPYDRQKLLTFPIPARIDSQTEFEITKKWINKFSKELSFCFDDWVPNAVNLKEFTELIKVPYIPFFSYGEQLSVIVQGVSDPAGLGYAYESLASILANNLEDIEIFVEQRDNYLNRGKNNAVEKKRNGLNVFISHSHKDKEFVNSLIAHLSTLKALYNLNYWNDSKIEAGQRINETITKAINESDIFIFIISPDFMNSKWALRELNYILNSRNKNNIIPIVAKPTMVDNTLLSDYVFLPREKPFSKYENKEMAFKEIRDALKQVLDRHQIDKDTGKEYGVLDKMWKNLNTNNLLELISKGELKEVFRLLSSHLSSFDYGFESETRSVILMNAEYNDLVKSHNSGILNYEQYRLSMNRINSYLIDLINNIEKIRNKNAHNKG